MPSGTQRGTHLDAKLKNEKSRDLRSKFRSLNETIRNDGEDLADYTKNLLTDRVRELDNLSKQVERPSEQADDSEAFYTLTQRGAEMAKRMAAGKGRTANDFIRHLKVLYVDGLSAQQDGPLQPTAFNWKRMSRAVNKYFRHAPGASCMLGPLDAIMKERKQVQRIQRKPVGKAVGPKILKADDAEAQEKRETERNMETMWNVLKPHPDGVGFLELTMNHKSFAQFAENNFTLAFLVHNKRAKISESENNNIQGLVVTPYSERVAYKEGKSLTQNQERYQFVLAYTMADWKNWQRFVREEDCLMPHRAAHDFEAELAAERFTEAADGSAEENAEDSAAEEEAGPSKPVKAARRRKGGRRSSQKKSRKSEDEDEEDDRDSEASEEELLVKPTARSLKRLRQSATE